jgi:hypothetical protein
MKKRIKHPSIGAYNAGRGSLQSLHPQAHRSFDSVQQYQLLTEWEAANNRTRDEARRLIRQNILLTTKYKGRWWVAVNPDCEDMIIDL